MFSGFDVLTEAADRDINIRRQRRERGVVRHTHLHRRFNPLVLNPASVRSTPLGFRQLEHRMVLELLEGLDDTLAKGFHADNFDFCRILECCS